MVIYVLQGIIWELIKIKIENIISKDFKFKKKKHKKKKNIPSNFLFVNHPSTSKSQKPSPHVLSKTPALVNKKTLLVR